MNQVVNGSMPRAKTAAGDRPCDPEQKKMFWGKVLWLMAYGLNE